MECFGRRITIDAPAKAMGIKLGVTCLSVGSVDLEESTYLKIFQEEQRKVFDFIKKSVKSSDEIKYHPVVRAYRDFFWRIGIDPTKIRPAGEALARRLFTQSGFRPISPIVDAGNLASALTMISIGLYDSDRIPGDLTLTLSRGGETFIPIGGETEIIKENIPILISQNIVLHLFPHRDSRLTCVTSSTRNIIGISAGVPGIDESLLIRSLETLIAFSEKLGVRLLQATPPVILT